MFVACSGLGGTSCYQTFGGMMHTCTLSCITDVQLTTSCTTDLLE